MATLKHHPIQIDKDNPFANCKLQRQPYAEVLTDIVKNYADGFVLAINNEWGTGKTTFVKMWEQHLKNEDFQTLYFNAWENDFEDDVLVALLSELKELKDDKTEEVFKEVVKRAAPLAKKLLPSVAKALAKKYIGDEFVQELIDGAADVSAEGLEAELKSYTNRKESIQSFRESLQNFVEAADPDKPVVFILDELDRCRPNYAVRVLEQIKHLFSVPGIVFVLSIDKSQLGHAVRGVYGSESLNADEYLRRFIDLEYTLPPATTNQFCQYLYTHHGFNEYVRLKDRSQFHNVDEQQNEFVDFSSLLFENVKLPLRAQAKIFAHTRVTLEMFKVNGFFFPSLLILIIFIRQHNPELYDRIKSLKVTVQGLLEEVEILFPKHLEQRKNYLFLDTLAQLVYFYNNSLTESVPLINYDDDFRKNITPLKSKFDTSPDQRELVSSLEHLAGHRYFDRLDLSYLMLRIELIEPFQKID